MAGNLCFSIESWSAWSSSMSEKSNWVDWANNIPVETVESPPLDVSAIPPMKRRRMSHLSKMAIATALDCLTHNTEKPTCVFASKNGELTRTVKILDSMVAQQDLSPTDFSLSVHNTASGLLSIQTDNKQPSTSIAAGDESFAYGLLEACILLSRYPEKPVLLVYFDEPLPDVLSDYDVMDSQAICVALLLSRGINGKSIDSAAVNVDANKIEFSFSHLQKDVASDKGNLGASFLQFLLTTEQQLEFKGAHKLWRWNRC